MDPGSGDVEWEFPLSASVKAVGVNPGTVFVLTADFRDPTSISLKAFDPRTGEVVWEHDLVEHQAFELLLVTEETVGIASRDPAGVIVFDAATGRIRFRVDMQPRTLYREPFLVDGDKLVEMFE